MKKTIPFGHKLKKSLSTGYKPKDDIYCFCGLNAMDKALAFSKTRLVLCLPPYEPPSNYYWPVAGCDILLFDTGNLAISDIEETAYVLLSSGASIVRAVTPDYQLIIFRKESI